MSNHNNKYTDVDKEALRLDYCFDRGINFKDRTIQITGSIEEGESFDWLDSALAEMERGSKKSIVLKINSPGGSVYEALAMVDRIQESKCQIITKGYGHIMSAASLLLAAGDKRYMGKRAWLMHHEISSGAYGTVTELSDHVHQLTREMRDWAAAMDSFSNRTQTFWLDVAKRKDAYLSATQCLDVGVIDDIL